jgi:tRNA(Ile)-lysidine synthase
MMAAGHDGPVAVAVSGGSDSTALLRLADEWAQTRRRELLVLSLDHGIRAASGAEVRTVIEIAAKLGHQGIALKGEPTSKGQASLRTMRHAKLAEAARAQGASLVLLGHTLSDMEETFLMRMRRGSALPKAAAPSPVSVSPLWPQGRGIELGRPLIAQRREALRDWLRSRSVAWIDDPGNLSPDYERVRMRSLIGGLGAPDRLTRIVRDASLIRAASDERLARDLLDRLAIDASGQITAELPVSEPLRSTALLQAAVQLAGGVDRLAERSKLLDAHKTLAAAGAGHRLTLAGGWIQTAGRWLLIGRDPGAVQTSWQGGLWDGRYARADQRQSDGDIPFLVRHAVPPGGAWREIISERRNALADALKKSAAIVSAIMADGDGSTRPLG